MSIDPVLLASEIDSLKAEMATIRAIAVDATDFSRRFAAFWKTYKWKTNKAAQKVANAKGPQT